MRLPRKLAKNDVDIKDYYAIKIGSIWRGLKQEKAVFWWLCIYIFLEYVRPAASYPALNFLPWAMLALLFTLITATHEKSVKWVSSPVNTLFILFFIIVFLSSIFAFHPSLSWKEIVIPINWIIFYFLFISIINTEKRFFVFMLLFLLINYKMAQHGFVAFASRGFAYTKWGVVGPPGWFGNAGDFGIAMIMYSSVAISFALSLKRYWGRYKTWFFYFFAVAGLVAIVASSSRGAQLGMVAMGAWFLLKSRQGIKALAAILIVSALLYSILPDEMYAEFSSAGDDGTSQDRLAHWGFGIDVALSHPGLGIGYNNWLVYCDFMNPYGLGMKDNCRIPHNTYISAAAELGLAGFVVYVFLAISIFVINAKTRKIAKNKNNNFIYSISTALDAGLFGYLIASIFFSVLFYPFFWLQLAMTVALNKVSKT